MRTPTPDFKRLTTVTDYTRFYGLPAPAHPLLTVVNLAQLPLPAALAATTPVVQGLYSVSLKRNLRNASLRYGRQLYDFSEGTMSFLAPGQGCWVEEPPAAVAPADLSAYVAALRAELSGWLLVFHPDLLRKYPLAQKIAGYGFFTYQVHEALHLSAQEEDLLEGLLRGIRGEYERPIDAFSQEVIVTQLDVLLTYANRFYHRQFLTRRAAEPDQISRFEALLSAHFAAETAQPLPTVQHFADALSISAAYLSDLLRTCTGQTAQQHLHRVLIEKAKQLLLNTSLSVNETAFQLGFDYPQYFSRLFKRKTGATPVAFRRAGHSPKRS
ncbi:AraC family transcriptional regulator [Hymenobacter psoromatis]|nr:AraC family transcriptional regulator [Hymenobacter psoromatis]